MAVTHLDGLVLARSVADTSMNYRSAVVHSVAHLVPVLERERALRVLSEHLAPGRWDEVRAPTRQGLAATAVLGLPLAAGTPRASALTRPGTTVPGSVRQLAGRLRPAP